MAAAYDNDIVGSVMGQCYPTQLQASYEPGALRYRSEPSVATSGSPCPRCVAPASEADGLRGAESHPRGQEKRTLFAVSYSIAKL